MAQLAHQMKHLDSQSNEPGTDRRYQLLHAALLGLRAGPH